MTRAIAPEPWTVDALCAQIDPEVWFPEKGCGPAASAKAKALCAQCPVQQPCLEAALERGEQYGIWGGTSEKDRRAMRRPGQEEEAA